jgi:outer membrane protein insertion porin family
VDPKLQAVDSTSTRLDLTYAVDEGQQSKIRRVNITGNTRTKDKVIRRELSVRPGQTFRRSSVARSQRDAFALGFFEDVQVDFKPVPGSNDIDLVYTVKEKTTGTASAGAGYSNDIGLTGFVQLGIPNFLGNGQSISLHLERGGREGKRQNYSLSFTEPWFLDTPTILGIDASYSTSERLGFPYLETVQGAGVRLGRPIPHIDYTRGYIDLRNQRLWRSDFDSLSVARDSTGFLASLQRQHYPQSLTSAALSLILNSTNNPFYPTAGARASFVEEVAGGPLGGFYQYHKDQLDARYYMHLPWRPALMLRARIGYLQGKTGHIPDYEYFRLGGTTTDPLRGYPDNSIVPKGNSLYQGGRFAMVLTSELQFLVVNPVHGVLFVDAGNTWNGVYEAQITRLFVGAGPGVRLEIPTLGPVGFDYAYSFSRKKWESHFILGVGF